MGAATDTVTTLASRACVLALGFLQSVLLARYLLPEGRGQLAMAMFLPQVVAAFTPLGLQWSVIYRLKSEPGAARSVVHTAWALLGALGLVGVALAFGLQLAFRQQLYGGLPVLALAASSLLVVPRMADQLFRGVYRALDRIALLNLATASLAALSLCSIALVLWLLRPSVLGLLLTLLVVEAVFTVAILSGIARRYPGPASLDGAQARALLSYGLRLYAYSVLLYLGYRVDLGLVRLWCSYQEVGYYVTAVALGEVLWNFPNAVSFVLFPKVVGADSSQDALTAAMCRGSVLVVGAGALGAALFATPVIRLVYGPAFVPAAWPLLLLLPGILANTVQQVTGAYVSGRGQPERVTWAALWGLVVNVAVNLVLIPRLGVAGAALASSVSYTVVAVIVLRGFSAISGLRARDALVPTGADARRIGRTLLAQVRRPRRERAV